MGNEGSNPQPSSGDILNLSGNDGVVMPPPPPSQSQPGVVVEPSHQHHPKQRAKLKDLEGIRASQSFDDSVLLVDGGADKTSPNSLQEVEFNLSVQGQQQQAGVENKPESIYESPPNHHHRTASSGGAKDKLLAAQGGGGGGGATSTPSESDYGRAGGPSSSIYSRAPSQCSSVSATQSFDMRMYGRTAAAAAAAKSSGKETPSIDAATGKLENPYYYYGSTRNQKPKGSQKPRPLLPSQRQALEMQARTGGPPPEQPSRPKSRQEQTSRPSSRQALLQHQESLQMPLPSQQQQQHSATNFQRSRSLGGYYAARELPPTPQDVPHGGVVHQPLPHPHPGSMTPLSYSKWQHGNENGHRRRHNPLYDTPPIARRQQQQQLMAAAGGPRLFQDHHQLSSSPADPHQLEYPDEQFLRFQLEQQQHHRLLMQQQQQQQLAQQQQLTHQLSHQQQLQPEIRGVVGTPPMRQVLVRQQQQHPHPSRQLSQQQLGSRQQLPPQVLHYNGSRMMADPLLSPILTDQEMSPMHPGPAPPTRRSNGEVDPKAILTDFLTSDDNLSCSDSSGSSCDDDRPASEEEEDDLVTSQATQGYSEGLADQSELDFSEVESVSHNYSSNQTSSHPPPSTGSVNPLQYSAMLKLYSGGGGPSTSNGTTSQQQQPSKKVSQGPAAAPDSKGLKVSSSNSFSTTSHPAAAASPADSTSAAAAIWQKKESAAEKRQDYTRVSTSESNPLAKPSTVFSSSDSDDKAAAEGATAAGAAAAPAATEYRWDGQPILSRGIDISSDKEEEDSEDDFTEDQEGDDDESALADIETDFEEQPKVEAAAASAEKPQPKLLARAHMEHLQEELAKKDNL